jgi:hypothetical protein
MHATNPNVGHEFAKGSWRTQTPQALACLVRMVSRFYRLMRTVASVPEMAL